MDPILQQAYEVASASWPYNLIAFIPSWIRILVIVLAFLLLFRCCGEPLIIMGKAIKDTSVDTAQALAALISPRHQLFNLNKFKNRIEQALPHQKEIELKELAHHLEDCQNKEESHTFLLNSLSQRVSAL